MIKLYFGFSSLIRKKPKSGNMSDMLRLKLMIAVVTIYVFFVRLSIAGGVINPHEVRQ